MIQSATAAPPCCCDPLDATGTGTRRTTSPSSARLHLHGRVERWGESASLSWVALHCRPRQEKRLAEDLCRLGIPGMLPMASSLRRYRGKGLQRSWLPLMPGYCFAVAGRECEDDIYALGRVIRLLRPQHPASLLAELSDLCALLERDPPSLLLRPELTPGLTVRVSHGALAGLSGVIIKRHGHHELAVNLPILGHCVSTRLEAGMVDLVEAED